MGKRNLAMTSLSSLSASSSYQSYIQNFFEKTKSTSSSSDGQVASNRVDSQSGSLSQTLFESTSASGVQSSEGASNDQEGWDFSSLGDGTLQAIFDSLGLENEQATSSLSDMIAAMDTDSDGTVTQEEFVASRPDDVTEEMANALWNSFDTESAGSLSREELQTAMAAGGAGGPPPSDSAAASDDEEDSLSSYISSLDTNEDGVISQEEFLAGRPDDVSEEMALNLWSRLDTEGAGELSVAALQTAMTENKPDDSNVAALSGASESEETDTLQALLDQLTSSTSSATEEEASTTVSALQELLEAIKAYESTAGYENTKLLMSSLFNGAA